jgi:hypothetical protein
MEERENRPAEPQARPADAEGDVEAHSVRPAANEEPSSEGESDDVEAHSVRPS